MGWLRKLTYLLGVLVLFVALPIEARADPITAGIIAIVAYFGATISAATAAAIATAVVSVGVSLGVGAIAAALRGGPKPINQPRPDITATTSRYGEAIPRIYKRFAVGGKIIYAGSVSDNTTTEQVGSGKKKQTINGHYNSQSFGVLVCENIEDTVLGVTKVWLNNNLVYNVNDYGAFGEADLDGTDQMQLMHGDEAYPNNDYGFVTYNPQAYVGKARNFRIALGTSIQTIDDVADWYYTDMAADIPGYRGYVTLWWNDMDLRDYYNRLPTVMVEVLTAHETLAHVVAGECELAGVDTGDLELTELADIPAPRTFNDTASPKSFFESLTWYRRFALVNVDGAVTGLLLPRDPSNAPDGSSSVNNGLLGTRQGGIEDGGEQPPKFSYREEQIGELPKKLNFAYYDADSQYEEASYPYSYPIGDASASTQVFPPIALSGDAEVIPLASAAMATMYSERSSLHLTLPPSFAQYHPGDVLTIPAPNNQLVDCRIQKMSFIPGQMVEVDAIRQIRKSNVGNSTEDNPDNMPSDVPGAPGGGPGEPVATAWVISNVPTLYDDHEMFAGVYGAATPLTEVVTGSQWTGATFVRNGCGSDDANQEYEYMGHTETPALIGVSLGTLASATGTDTTNTVDIEFPYGVTSGLETIHNDAWVNTTTQNLCILGKEVLQFKTITDLVTDPPSYRLSNLKRGLRDTVAFVGTHASDEPFVLVTPQSVIRLPVNINEHSTNLSTPIFNWKCYTDGEIDTEVDPIPFVIGEGGATTLKENP